MRGTRADCRRRLKVAIEDGECNGYRRAIKAHEHVSLDVTVDWRHPHFSGQSFGFFWRPMRLLYDRSTRLHCPRRPDTSGSSLANASMLCAAALLVAMLLPLACSLATRQEDSGPCDVNTCYTVIDSSACWNAYVTGAIREGLTGIYDCAPGGKSEVRREMAPITHARSR
jgi:hypothetical protein